MDLNNNIDNYFYTKKNDIDKILIPTIKFKFKLSYDDNTKEYTITIVDVNNKLIMRALYDIIGIFNIINSVWYWSYNIDMIDRNLQVSSSNIKKVPEYIVQNYKNVNSKEMDYIYYICTNGNFYVTELDNIQKMIKLCMFINNGVWYVPIVYDMNNIPEIIYSEIDLKKYSRIEYLMITQLIQI